VAQRRGQQVAHTIGQRETVFGAGVEAGPKAGHGAVVAQVDAPGFGVDQAIARGHPLDAANEHVAAFGFQLFMQHAFKRDRGS
jgi:hypothetical protein